MVVHGKSKNPPDSWHASCELRCGRKSNSFPRAVVVARPNMELAVGSSIADEVLSKFRKVQQIFVEMVL